MTEIRDAELLAWQRRAAACLAGPVVLDLSAVTFIDPTGLGVVAGGWRRSRDAGHPFTVCPGEPVLRALRRAGLLAVVDTAPDVEAALRGSGR